jgi:hypothetical protein
MLPLWRAYQQHDSLAKEWSVSRGYPTELDVDWGYAPEGNTLRSAGIDRKTIELAGLASEKGELFSNRVVFPVKNFRGKIVGFQARAVEDSPVKWLASKPNIYGSIDKYFYFPQQVNLKSTEPLFLCEGVTDALALKVLGIEVLGSFGIQRLPLDLLLQLERPLVAVYDCDYQDFSCGERTKSWQYVLPQLAWLQRQRPDLKISCWKLPTISGATDCFDVCKYYNWHAESLYAHYQRGLRSIPTLAVETIHDLQTLLEAIAGLTITELESQAIEAKVLTHGGWLKTLSDYFL